MRYANSQNRRVRLMRAWLALTLTVGSICAGCAAVRRPAVVVPPQVLPSAAQLEAALTSRREAVHSLRALARIRYRDPDGSHSARQAIIAARPDRVRIEVTTFVGSIFVLTSDDGALTAWERQENTVYRGQASPENLWRYIHVELPVSELVDIVLGTPPPRPGAQAEVSFDSQAGSVRLWQRLAAGALVVWFSESELPVAAEERGADGQPLWRATFGEYRDLDGFPMATRIGLEAPIWHRALEMDLDSIDLNPELDRSVFALQTPPGSKVVTLDPVAD
jgi:outer membrane biogenesis lipoprotein LolB